MALLYEFAEMISTTRSAIWVNVYPMGVVQSISELAFWVEDVERSMQFYIDRFGFELEEHSPGQHAFLRSHDFLLVLFNPANPGTHLADEYLGRAGGPKGGLYHVALKVDRRQLDDLAKELEASGTAVKGPIDFGSGRRSFFFDDPDGHYIELTDR